MSKWGDNCPQTTGLLWGFQGTCGVPSGAQRVMGAAVLTSGSVPAPSVMTGLRAGCLDTPCRGAP